MKVILIDRYGSKITLERDWNGPPVPFILAGDRWTERFEALSQAWPDTEEERKIYALYATRISTAIYREIEIPSSCHPKEDAVELKRALDIRKDKS